MASAAARRAVAAQLKERRAAAKRAAADNTRTSVYKGGVEIGEIGEDDTRAERELEVRPPDGCLVRGCLDAIGADAGTGSGLGAAAPRRFGPARAI
jgi:hypothetical protein